MTSSQTIEQPSDGAQFELRLPSDLHCIRKARQFVADVIADWGASPPERAAILTSEVVSNAMVHAGGEVTIRVRRDGSHALVEVHDSSSEPPEPQPHDAHRVGGNGMHIVEGLASSWGVTQIEDDGKIVWFEVALPG